MRLLHVHSGNLYGGVETVLRTVARHSGAGSVESEFALCFDGRIARELREAGAHVHLLGPVRVRNPYAVARARRRLKALVGSRRYDVVLLHSPWALALFGPVVRRSGTAVALSLHDQARGKHWVERWSKLSPPDLVLCNSEFTRGTVDRLFPRTRSLVLRCPVETGAEPLAPQHRLLVRAEFDTPAESTVIVQVSRMEAWKGHTLHLEALHRLRHRDDWICWMVGGAQRAAEKTYAQQLQALAVQLGVDSKVRFLGQRADVARVLGAADIHCQPNLGPEPFGITFIEAMSHGLPVVSTDLGGAREIIDTRCGQLVPPGNADRLAEVIGELLDDPNERARLGAAGRRRARELCDPPDRIAEMGLLLSQVVSAGPVTHR